MKLVMAFGMLAATPALGAGANLLAPSAGTANVLTLSVDGDRNGGTGDFASLLDGAPMPGTLVREGTGNILMLAIEGDDTLFAIEQIGRGNVASILVSGMANQMAIVQHGMHNVATVSQTGTGNIVAIRQGGL